MLAGRTKTLLYLPCLMLLLLSFNPKLGTTVILSKERLIYHTVLIVTNLSDIMPSVNIQSEGAKSSNKILGLSARRNEVLQFLAREGPLNIYQIQQKLGLTSYSTAHGSVKALEEGGLLVMQSLEQTEKGVTAKVYGLTFVGLAFAMTCEDIWTGLEKVVKVWGHVAPLPLRKYAYFARCGLKDEALKCFRHAFGVAFRELFELSRMLRELFGRGERVEEVLTKSQKNAETKFKEIWSRVFLESAIGPQPMGSLLKWYKALRGDQEVRDWAVQTLRKEVSKHRSWADIKNGTLQIVDMSQEPAWGEIKKRGTKWPAEISWDVHV